MLRRAWWMGVAACLLLACGGGGGGGSTPTPAPTLSMSVSPQSLSVTAAVTDAAPSASVTITLSTQPTSTLYVAMASPKGYVTNATVVTSTATTSTLSLSFLTPASLGVGTFTENLQIGVFTDQAGTKPIGNSPVTIPVTYTITGVPAPTLASLTPASAVAGGAGFTLTLTGTRFTFASVASWNGSTRTTTYLSSTQLTIQVSASDLATPGQYPVTVDNGASAGGVSNAVNFTVQTPPFGISRLSPSTTYLGTGAFVLTVLGSQFDPTAVVQWNGSDRATTYVSSTQLKAQVTAADVAAAGIAQVTVRNPAAAGGTSSAATFSVAKPDAVAFQVDSGHTGAITFTSMTLPSTSLWKATLDGPPSYALLAQGMVYLTVPISGGSELVALDQATGAVVWGPLLIGGASNAAYDGGKVFVGSTTGFTGAMVQAYDAASGTRLWSANLPYQWSFNAMPTARNGRVYLTESGGGTTTYAFDGTTGALLWTQLTDAGSYGGAAVTDYGVYVAGPQENYVFNPVTGQLLWSYLLGGDGGGGALPVVTEGWAFMPDGFGTYNGHILNPLSGALLGSYVADCPPAVTSTTGYFLQQGTLRGVKLSNSQILWSFAGDGALTTSPIVVNNTVFIGSSNGNLYGLDATTGAQVWTKSLGAAIPGGATWGRGLPFSGLNAGNGLLMVPAGNTLTAFKLQ